MKISDQPPSMRDDRIYQRFLGAVKTRIAMKQGKLRSLFCKPFIRYSEITRVWPEDDMQFFSVDSACVWRSYNLNDLGFDELVALERFLTYDITL